MSLRDQNRGLSARDIRSMAAMGFVGNAGTIRQSDSIRDRFLNTHLHRAFVSTGKNNRRLTDAAYLCLVETYVHNALRQDGVRDAKRKQEVVTAVHSLGWMHPEAQDQDLDDSGYAKIDNVLSLAAPEYRGYVKTMQTWSDRVTHLQPDAGGVQPLRAVYHAIQLHYIHPEMVGPTMEPLITSFCNFADQNDMVIPANFQLDMLTEDDWEENWKQMTLKTKLRYFELVAVLNYKAWVQRANTYHIITLIAVAKAGNVTDQWLLKRIDQYQRLGQLDIEPGMMTADAVTDVFKNFIAVVGVTPELVYNLLCALYSRANEVDISPLKWTIEQATGPNTASLSVIATTIKGVRLRYEHLAHLGVPENEFTAFAKMVVLLMECRFVNVVRAQVPSRDYSTLTNVCRDISSTRTFLDLKSSNMSLASVAQNVKKAASEMARRFGTQLIQVLTAPEVIARTRYGCNLVVDAQGNYQMWEGQGPAPVAPGGAGWGAAKPAAEWLLSLPNTAKDEAFDVLCDAIIQNGAQEAWTNFNPRRAEGPYRRIPDAVRNAGIVFGYTHPRIDPPVYNPPARIRRAIVRPPWDLGCLGHHLIPEDVETDDDDNDDQPNQPGAPGQFPPRVVNPQESEPGCILSVLAGLSTLQEVRRAHSAAVQPQAAQQPLRSTVSAPVPLPRPEDVPGPSGLSRPIPPVMATPVATPHVQADDSLPPPGVPEQGAPVQPQEPEPASSGPSEQPRSSRSQSRSRALPGVTPLQDPASAGRKRRPEAASQGPPARRR